MSTARKCQTKYLAKSIAVYSLVSAGLILSAKMLFAQENTRSVTIVPPAAEFRVNPGEKREGILKVTNNGDETLTFSASAKDFIVQDTVGTPLILPEDTLSKKYSASAWIAVVPNTFTLAPGKTQQLNYYLQVPADGRPGGRYAAIVYQPQKTIDVQGTGTGVEARLGSLFYIRINGDIVESATVKKFAAEKGFLEQGPAVINTQITNGGDAHIRPVGIVVLKNFFGQTVESQALTENNIFPEAARDYTNTLGKDQLLFGQYTVELRANYGDNKDKTLFATTTFMVFPYKVVGVIVLLIVVLVLLALFMRRRKRQKVVAPAQASQPAPQQATPPQQTA